MHFNGLAAYALAFLGTFGYRPFYGHYRAAHAKKINLGTERPEQVLPQVNSESL